MKNFYLAAVLAACLSLSACERTTVDTQHPPLEQEVAPVERGVGGIGLTYGGRLGMEIAPGLVLGFDGKLGFGFGL